MSELSKGIETTTRAFLEKVNAGTGPQLYEMSVADARKTFIELQTTDLKKPAADIEERKVPGGPMGEIPVYIVRPSGVKEALPALVYMHGAGWVLGGWQTHDRLILELVNKAQVAVVFVEYSLSPEAKQPTALEEGYLVTKYVVDNARALNIDSSKLALGGDSVGGNMAAILAMMCKERGGPRIDFQLLFYPVTDSSMSTESYKKFASKHFLSTEAMKWFWSQYEPDAEKRKQPYASPLNASLEQLKGLPPAAVFTAEFDVLRDEGEAYAHKLLEAGVSVKGARCLGTIHDFVMLHALAETPAAKLAVTAASAELREHLLPAKAGVK